MKKVQKNENMFVLAGVLFVITAVVALLLSAVNRVTAVRIEENTQREQAAARSAVLQSADTFAEVTAESDATGLVQQIFEGQKDGQLAGYCVSVAPAGFGGTIDMMVGIQPDGRIEGVKIVSLSETPGLGSKAQDDSF
ncbi:MAG: FMN-binding protein, partial [Clostridia bacterium]